MNKIAFIYPGQGAQKAGMGKDFYAYSPLAAEIYDKASEILNIDMKALCFEENDLLDQTEYTQAAMVTTCLAMTAVLEEAGLNPDVTAGLSLGDAECQRTVPFTDDDSGRRSAGSGDGRYAVVRTENPLCDQCHSGICHRYS